MKSSRFLYKHSQKILQKFVAVFAIFVISGQAIFAPFVTFAAPGEMPAETLHSAPVVEVNVEKIAENSGISESAETTKAAEIEDVATENHVKAAENPANENFAEEKVIENSENAENIPATETGAIIESAPTTSAVDLSTPENVATSARNVVSNAADEVVTLAEKVEKMLASAGENLESVLAAPKAGVEISTQGATDLSIKIDGQTEAENNRYLVYKITVTNEGPSDANGSNLKVSLPEGLRKIVLTCVESNEKTECPNEETYSDGSREINKQIGKLLVGGKLVFDLKAKLPLNPPTSVNFTTEVSVPAGMTDTNIKSNQAILNTRIVGGRADVAVTSFSAADIADMNPTTQIADEKKGTKEIVFNNPHPISYTVRYENEGPGYADGAGINMYLNLGDNIYDSISRKLEYENMTITCTASDGAVCPAEFKNNNNQENPRDGWKETGTWSQSHYINIFHESYTKIPELSAHSYIDVTVTFTPKKLTFVERDNRCIDRNVAARIGIDSVSVAIPSGITDVVTTNNFYDLNTLEKIAKNSNTGKLPLPNINQSCPNADLAVTEVSQGFAGKIETTAEPNANGFGQNLIINNPQELSYTVKYENKGNVAVENARIGMILGWMPNNSVLHFEGLKFECEATGGAVCPHAYNSSATEVWGTEWETSFNHYNRTSFFREKNDYATYHHNYRASEVAPNMPANSSLKITVKFTPKKITTNIWDRCGTDSRDIKLQLWQVGIHDYNDYITDPNGVNNNAEFVEDLNHYNHHYARHYLAFDNIRTTDMSAANFGKVMQTNCPEPPKTDLAVTEVSQSFVGQLPTEIRRSENQYYTYPHITEEKPVTFTVKYENLGADAADGARAELELKGGWQYGRVEYKDLKYSCTTTGGATCPVELINFNENKGNRKTGDISGWWYTSVINNAIPKFPAGSSVEIAITLTPVRGYIDYNTCGNGAEDTFLQFHAARISLPSGVTNTNNQNDYYSGFDANAANSLQRISRGEIGAIQIGRVEQQTDVCKRSRVSVEVETNSPEDKQLMEGREFEYDVIYKNTSSVDVENVDIEAFKDNYAGVSSWESRDANTLIDYSNFSVSCVATGESVCPTAQPNPDDIPYGSNVSQSSGEWRYYTNWNTHSKDNILFKGRIPMLKGNSEVRMKVRYTLSNPRVKSFIHSANNVAFENIHANARLNQNTFTSNDGTLSRVANYNHIWMNDTYINNKFVERGVGDGECINPALMTRNGTAQTTPNKNMCLYVEVGNAGVADANNFTFTSTIPHGLTNINPSEIKCTVTAGGDTTICGDELYFDPETRILTGKIAKMKTGGKVVISIPGRTVDYSSSWKSVNKILPPSGWFERLPDTNISEQSFSIVGSDPSITKSASVRTATVGDEFDYTITMRNPDSGESLKNVKITDLIPDSFYYVGTNDVILTGNARAENANPNRNSLTESISGQNIDVDADIDAWKRPIRNDEKKLEWGTFAVPSGGSVTISLKVRVKEVYSCSEIIHNSAWAHYTLQNNISAVRSYDGSLVGFDLEDIELIGCKEILAKTDIVNLSQTVRNGKNTLVPDAFNILENDGVYSPGLNGIRADDVTIKVANIRTLNKQLLYAGSSDGISSKGADKMTGGFKIGNRLAGKGGVTPLDRDIGITIFDYNELPNLQIDEQGNITWKNNLDTGAYLGAYEICDKINTLNCSMAPIIVVVPNKENNAPKAVADVAKTVANTSIDIDVLKNDTDPDDDVLVIDSVDNPQNGEFIIEAGKIKFTPAFDFVGVATANYTVDDGHNGRSSAKISVYVEKTLNHPPVAINDSDLTNINTPISVDVLKNDSDPEKDVITLTNVSVVNDSGVAEIRDQKLYFTPKQDFVGMAVVIYTITDTEDNVANAVAIIRVVNNTAPIAIDDTENTRKNEVYTINVLANDSDPESDSLIIESVSDEKNGTFEIVANKIKFTPKTDFVGEARAKYTIFDGTNGRATANIIVTVSETIPPVAIDDVETVDFNQTIEIDVLANDSDPRNHELTIEAIADQTNGKFIIRDKKVIFTPNADFYGEATARYSVNNGNGGVASATITVNVSEPPVPPPAPNNPPVAKNDEKTTEKNSEIIIPVLENDSDIDNDILTITSVSNQEGGRFTIESGEIRFVPDNDFIWNAKAIYTIDDGKGGVAMATVVVVVRENTFTATDTLEKTGKFTRQCESGYISSSVDYTHRIALSYTSKISLEDAKTQLALLLDTKMNQEFDAAGQDYANIHAKCDPAPTFVVKDSLSKTDIFTKKCEANQTTKPVSYTHTITDEFISSESLEHAKEELAKKLAKKMDEEFKKAGQDYADKNGVCETKSNPPKTGGSTSSNPPSTGGGSTSSTPPVVTSKPPVSTPQPIPPVPQPEIPTEPLFSAPVINGQCVSAVKNLDDPKLIAYYDDLQIINRENVNRQISRVEFVKLVLNAGKVDLNANDYSSYLVGFSDIDKESWYAPYVAYMIATGSMSGQEVINENGEITKIFRPNDTISRAEASKILSELVRKSDQKLPSLEEIISFEDVNPEESLSAYIQFAFDSCLLHGRNTINGQPIDGAPRVFEPFDSITLAETSKVLYNITHSGVDSNDVISEFFNNAEKFIKTLDNSSKNTTENTATGEIVSNNLTSTGAITPVAEENKQVAPVLIPTLNIGGKNQTLQDLVP